MYEIQQNVQNIISKSIVGAKNEILSRYGMKRNIFLACVTCLKFCQIEKLIDASTTSFLISYCMITYFRLSLSLR